MKKMILSKTILFHKNKTLAALLAMIGGGIGLHRFYLKGIQDTWGWIHIASLVASLWLLYRKEWAPPFFCAMPFFISILTGLIMALIIGVTPDDKWDEIYHPDTPAHTKSSWPIAVILVISLGLGATGLLALLARTIDLLYTQGFYG